MAPSGQGSSGRERASSSRRLGEHPGGGGRESRVLRRNAYAGHALERLAEQAQQQVELLLLGDAAVVVLRAQDGEIELLARGRGLLTQAVEEDLAETRVGAQRLTALTGLPVRADQVLPPGLAVGLALDHV